MSTFRHGMPVFLVFFKTDMKWVNSPCDIIHWSQCNNSKNGHLPVGHSSHYHYRVGGRGYVYIPNPLPFAHLSFLRFVFIIMQSSSILTRLTPTITSPKLDLCIFSTSLTLASRVRGSSRIHCCPVSPNIRNHSRK